MAQIPHWYRVTRIDRLYLVKNGVPYELAEAMPDDEVLRDCEAFHILDTDGWLPPLQRAPALEKAKEMARDAVVDFVGERADDTLFAQIERAIREAICCETECSTRINQQALDRRGPIMALVHHKDGRFHVVIGNEVHITPP